ncbi:unnamed protein product [Caenorhabditis brenneri]
MPLVQQPLPTKAFYLDRLGNMSTSSSIISSTSSVSSATSCSTPGAIGGAAAGSLTQIGRHKQILSLKPKQPNTYVQHLEHKPKDSVSSSCSSSSSLMNAAPVTMLALKKKDKTGKNVVTQLTYRKPNGLFSNNVSTSSSSGGVGGEDTPHKTLLRYNNNNNNSQMATTRRPGSPSSSGYETDSLLDQENCDVFSSILNASFGYNSLMQQQHHHHHDMLHSHPIWSPQPSTTSSTSSSNGLQMMTNHFMENEKSNKFLVQ